MARANGGGGGRNLLILFTDEHRRDALGCYGHRLVQTPHLDRLAARGTRFENAYTPSPICVPARAALATGRYVHDNRCWSNAQPFRGQVRGWGHRLMEEGHPVVSIGKLHYRSSEDPNGFDQEVLPMHVHNGIGWVRGLLRDAADSGGMCRAFAEQIGPGEDPYSDFDRLVCRAACAWLEDAGRARRDRPWVLFVSFVRPHYPLTCPRPFHDLYPLEHITPPQLTGPGEQPDHPVVAHMRRFLNYDDYFDDHNRRVARASYYGLCSFVDDLVGRVLDALEASGQDKETLVLYTSDHGECLGDRGLWTKCVMYEEAAAVPMILTGPGLPEGRTNTTPVSLIDLYQTVLQGVGLLPSDEEAALPGQSLIEIAEGAMPARTLLSEFHDGGAVTGMFMIRHGRWKYVHYPGYAPQLFDLAADPLERNDLGSSPHHDAVRQTCEAALRAVVDPDAANDLAFADQAALIAELGGAEEILATENYDFTPPSAET